MARRHPIARHPGLRLALQAVALPLVLAGGLLFLAALGDWL